MVPPCPTLCPGPSSPTLCPVPMAVSPLPSAPADLSKASPSPCPPPPSVPVTLAASALAPAAVPCLEVSNVHKGSTLTDNSLDELSVFNIQNTFRARWFLNKDQLVPNVASAQKDDKGHLSWVEFTPHFHTHLLQCARRVLPPSVPVVKVKRVMFVFLLEVLSGELPQKGFFSAPASAGKQNAKATARRTRAPRTAAAAPSRTPAAQPQARARTPAQRPGTTRSTANPSTRAATPWDVPKVEREDTPQIPLTLWESLTKLGPPLPPCLKKGKQRRALSAAEFDKVKHLRMMAGTAERLTMTIGEQQELAALSACQFYYGRLVTSFDPSTGLVRETVHLDT